jgi:hypothetical protein
MKAPAGKEADEPNSGEHRTVEGITRKLPE